MNPFKRYVFQVLLWLGIWLIVWLSLNVEPRFIRANGPAFLLQCILLLVLIYHTVPQFLFKGKLFYFLTLIVLLILITSYVSMEMGPPNMDRLRPPRAGRTPPFLESRFFRQLLIMSVTSLSAVMVETFTLAQQKQKSEAMAKAELKESELKFLKMQINPHFLFNALNNIYALSVTNSEKTQEGISTLSLMLRYVLYDCERPQIQLRKELEYIRHFIRLFKLKSSQEYNIKLVEESDDDSVMVAPMLFVPFIENSFKHSGIEKRGDNFVNIKLIAKSNTVEFTVVNSLPDVPLVIDAHSGIGIQNVEKRLALLYPKSHVLTIEKTNQFYVNLKINLS